MFSQHLCAHEEATGAHRKIIEDGCVKMFKIIFVIYMLGPGVGWRRLGAFYPCHVQLVLYSF